MYIWFPIPLQERVLNGLFEELYFLKMLFAPHSKHTPYQASELLLYAEEIAIFCEFIKKQARYGRNVHFFFLILNVMENKLITGFWRVNPLKPSD